MKPNQRRCAKCGYEGHHRSMRYTVRGEFVCTSITRCAKRKADKDQAKETDERRKAGN